MPIAFKIQFQSEGWEYSFRKENGKFLAKSKSKFN